MVRTICSGATTKNVVGFSILAIDIDLRESPSVYCHTV